jgi:hypothetical protein
MESQEAEVIMRQRSYVAAAKQRDLMCLMKLKLQHFQKLGKKIDDWPDGLDVSSSSIWMDEFSVIFEVRLKKEKPCVWMYYYILPQFSTFHW